MGLRYMDVYELIGVTLGSCTIERLIGRGSMGAVFLAQQARPVRTVAVKVLLPAPGSGPEGQRTFLERFRREADTLAKLEHKNILPVYEYAEAVVKGQQLAYLVMPYMRGGTLRERIDEMKRQGRQFDLETVASYISQVAEALTYAHSLGIVHRDVKPANLLFHPDGRLLLSDFGIVHLQATPALTKRSLHAPEAQRSREPAALARGLPEPPAGNFPGTAEYASPEQVSGNEVDARSDIYSLGIMLYELLTGNVPFSGPNPFAIMSKHLKEPVPPVKKVRPDVSPAIEFVVKKALAKNPADRYRSAAEMAADLRAAISPALAAAGGLRLHGDANNDDLTVADRAWEGPQSPMPQSVAVPVPQAVGAVPPTEPAFPAPTPWQRNPGPWQWPSPAANAQLNVPVSPQAARSTDEAQPAASPAYRQGRRLFYFGVILAAVLLQLLVFAMLNAPPRPGTMSLSVLGELLGTAINLLALAAIAVVAVTRSRNSRTYFIRCLVVTLIAPVVSGFFIGFGAGVRPDSLHIPLAAYGLLLLSNIYAIRQLGFVDAAREQSEIVPVLWRSALVGALTGLLPLTMILILALTMPLATTSPPLLHVFGVLLIALIGAPTPGAVLAVWLSQKMAFPVFLRTSAVAGMLMFVGAFLLAVLWSVLTASHTLFFYQFSQPELALFVGICSLGLIGVLRGMLDAWVYQRIRRKGDNNT